MKKDNEKCKVKNKKCHILTFAICILQFAVLLSGCAAYRVGGEIQPGRYALLRGDPKSALAHFQRAAEIDPNSIARLGPIKEGVWTYLGRAHYANGDLAAARKALEQARSRHTDDSLAPLYLGLVLSRDGDRQGGAKELQTGLTGLGNWLEYIDRYTLDGPYWDPGRIIRSRIEKDLAALQGKEINWTELIASVERVGLDVENEADEALRQKRKERRDSAKGDDKSN